MYLHHLFCYCQLSHLEVQTNLWTSEIEFTFKFRILRYFSCYVSFFSVQFFFFFNTAHTTPIVCVCPSKPKLHFSSLFADKLLIKSCCSSNSVRLADSLKQALEKTALGCTWHLFSSLYFIKGTLTLLHQCSHNFAKLVACLPSAVVLAVELCGSPAGLSLQQALVYSHSIWKTW